MDGAVAIVLAAGSGERLGLDRPKAFVELAGRPMLVHAVAAALDCPGISAVVVAAPPGAEDLAHAIVEPFGSHAVVEGGSTRRASVRAALEAVPGDVALVVVHDAARPFATSGLFGRVLEQLAGVDGVVPVVPVPDTVKRVDNGMVVTTEPRDGLVLAQTPQAFLAIALREAHERAERDDVEVTDDAMALERAGFRVRAIAGEPGNFKITTAEDLARAEAVALELARG
ncbi:MAG TPA: 2-C-methyl-D-erythritol 4-phosphate cytidylyltransferase [Actinomycetota bacterium]|nr:2-C-methyl-D-erythritol 4-phosphate cytidylyltransferase [Actinomycetota bacterium]